MSRQKMIVSALALSILSAGALYASAPESDHVPFPKFYRLYTVAKTRFIGPNNPGFPTNGGVDIMYANWKAVFGYDSRPFDEGSVIVEERVHADENSSGVWKEGATTWVAVMVKDSRRYRDTGGWGFNQFFGADRVGLTLAQAKTQCFDACHAAQAERDFVIHDFRRP